MEIVNYDDYLDQLDRESAENSKWAKIAQNETKRYQFIIRGPIVLKEDEYQGQKTGVIKAFYTVVDVNSTLKKEQTFKANPKSTKLTNKALRCSKDGILDITHKGTANKTVYIPRVVNPKNETERDTERLRELEQLISQVVNGN